MVQRRGDAVLGKLRRWQVSGDVPLNHWQQVWWLLDNVAALLVWSRWSGDKVPTGRFDASQWLNSEIIQCATPARALADAFWSCIDFDELESALGGHIAALEIGCGSGRYGEFLVRSSVGSTYVGVDIQKSAMWAEREVRFHSMTFWVGDALSALCETEANLIFTQSALAHIQDDDQLLARLASRRTRSPEIQMHIVAAPSNLFLYPFLGYRQYHRHQLDHAVAQSVDGVAQTMLVPLGGLYTTVLHFATSTVPRLLRRRPLQEGWPALSRRALAWCAQRDARTRLRVWPSSYVLLIARNCPVPVDRVLRGVTAVGG